MSQEVDQAVAAPQTFFSKKKKVCRKMGIKQWPHRKLKAVEKRLALQQAGKRHVLSQTIECVLLLECVLLQVSTAASGKTLSDRNRFSRQI